MFIRNERSVKEFIKLYPIVSGLVIIHLALWLIISFLKIPFALDLYNWGVGSNYLINQGEYWRLVTPIFLHGGLMHAVFNSFALVLFGPALEQMLGKTKFIMAYFGAGLAGNIATYILGPSDYWYIHVGASGAIYGLFGIYIFMIAFRKHLIDKANSQIVLTIFIIGLIMTLFRSNINDYAHIFGFIGGFIIAPLVLTKNIGAFYQKRNYGKQYNGSVQFDPNRWNKKRIPRKLKANILWIILGVLVLFGIIGRFL